MAYSGILRRIALVTTDVSEELSASIIMVTRIDELGTSVLIKATRRNIPEDGFLHFSAYPALQHRQPNRPTAQGSTEEFGISSQRTSVASCGLCCS
jgi:hypothetical protein